MVSQNLTENFHPTPPIALGGSTSKIQGPKLAMNTITHEPNNEADTGATVPAPAETAACEKQSTKGGLPPAAAAINQKNLGFSPPPNKQIPAKPAMRMTRWGFEVPVYQPNNSNVSFGASPGRRLDPKEFLAQIEVSPLHETAEQEVPASTQVKPTEASSLLPCTVVDHAKDTISQEQKQQATAPLEKHLPSLAPAPVSFDWLPKCPAPGTGVNVWCLTAALSCKRHGLSAEDSLSVIHDNISCTPRGNEIERAVKKAYLTDPLEKLPPSITTKFDEAELRALAYNAPHWGSEALKRVSPVDVCNCTTIQYLCHIFKTGEHVIIATSLNDRGTVWLNDPDHPNSTDDELDSFKHPLEGKGAWFLSNPVNGKAVELERLKSEANPDGESLRAEENLTSFKYLVLESDEAPQDLWLSALVQLPLPIVSIVNSGGKSLHALVRVNAANGDHWRAIKQRIGPALVLLGADKNALTAVRLTRLPGSYRAEKAQWQELLYLNPHADGTPICQLPARDAVTNQH